MASNKNQHFVPRCYLRPFTTDVGKKLINLYNIDREVLVSDVPIKHQCSRDYFYGDDNKLESIIQEAERRYASVVNKIVNSENITKEESKYLVRFVLLQYLRTEAASRRSVEATKDTSKMIGLSSSRYNLEVKEAVKIAMDLYAGVTDAFDDLAVVFIKNKTETPFVSSDDPAVMINKWANNNIHVVGVGIGISTAGIICILPISPDICCCAYDGDIYVVPHKNGWIRIENSREIDKINVLQYCNSFANLYFNTDGSNKVPYIHEQNKEFRPQVRHKIIYAVEEESGKDYTTYVQCSPDDDTSGRSAMVHMQILGIKPPTWPTIFRIRSTACAYTNGTGVGYIRREHIKKSGGPDFQKVKVRGKMKNLS